MIQGEDLVLRLGELDYPELEKIQLWKPDRVADVYRIILEARTNCSNAYCGFIGLERRQPCGSVRERTSDILLVCLSPPIGRWTTRLHGWVLECAICLSSSLCFSIPNA